jgi:hypothetical protein
VGKPARLRNTPAAVSQRDRRAHGPPGAGKTLNGETDINRIYVIRVAEALY